MREGCERVTRGLAGGTRTRAPREADDHRRRGEGRSAARRGAHDAPARGAAAARAFECGCGLPGAWDHPGTALCRSARFRSRFTWATLWVYGRTRDSMRTGNWNTLAMVAGVIALAIGGPWLAGQLKSLPHQESLAARAGQRVVALEVGGMTCAGCAAKVSGELSRVAGVSAVDVRLRQQRAFVVCDRAVSDTSLVAAVHRAGPGFLAAVSAP
ncbi:MAG: heavy-metal-associated domain-containing protein [Candidatus Eisenbacteria bacterium]|uniref:Heavy-metal-associated domain-containing protein n=1 Tax=Eiseniibacteriota bacterium TaxID=2212470 RepID=A0A538TV02_UNCEI|nr:MAG: heavy-metal-associated domain-containing protein [Candidatus Eisenbacteria bacterium]